MCTKKCLVKKVGTFTVKTFISNRNKSNFTIFITFCKGQTIKRKKEEEKEQEKQKLWKGSQGCKYASIVERAY